MSYTLTLETPDGLASSWSNLQHLRWDNIFVLPHWLAAWWHQFGAGADLYLCAVRENGTVLGIAPLLLKGGKASFIGSADVCDYLDFVVAQGREQAFFESLLDSLGQEGISRLELSCLRSDSTTLVELMAVARKRGYEVSCKPQDVSLEIDLPDRWEGYLEMLTTKQGREVRRKLRRLWEAGDIDYRVVTEIEAVPHTLDLFLELMRASREDKAAFMTDERESFLRAAVGNMASAGLLRFGILHLNARPVAALTCFEYEDKVYLYNSGYDPEYSYLSVGLLSKVMCIRDSIERGKKVFDFLKGGEVYKYRLGGKEIAISECQIAMK